MKKRHLNLLKFGLLSFFFIFLTAFLFWGHNLAMDYVHPQRREMSSGEELTENGIIYEEIEILSHDGLKLSGWYTPPKNGAVILVAHGHTGTRPLKFYQLFAEHGYGVLALDFRAHGISEGDTTTLGYLESQDIESALEFALKKPSVEHIGAWGGSMGGASVILAASRREEIEAVIADSAFFTLEDTLKTRVSIPVLRGVVRFFAEQETGMNMNWVRPVDVVGSISPRPIFIIQGMQDTSIPVNSAQNLYDAAGEPRFLWTETEASHLRMYDNHQAEYTEKAIGFFDAFLLK